jgi:uncharacterized protein YndB with AHSA1/START domain
VKLQASRELLALREEVWNLLAEPYHLSDWWPGYTAIRPDRRGLVAGARWGVVRSSDPGLLRRPGGEGTIIIRGQSPGQVLSWHDVDQAFDAEIRVRPGADGTTIAELTLAAAWWRITLEGLRGLPAQALARLHALCQTAAEL